MVSVVGQMPTGLVIEGRNKIFADLIEEKGPIVTFQEVCDEFLDNGLSQASAIAALQFSPITKQVSYGLHTIRGNMITQTDFLTANDRRERISANAETKYTPKGEIIYSLNIGAWGLRGVIALSGFENLTGNWDCRLANTDKICTGKLSEIYIYGLAKPIEKIGAKLGDRIELKFNVENRILTISKVA